MTSFRFILSASSPQKQMWSLFSEPSQPRAAAYVRGAEQALRPARKRALVIGLNYFGSPLQTHGCLDDASSVADALKLRLHVTDTRLLQDAPGSAPVTRAVIFDAFDWLLAGAERGDVLFLHFSGRSASAMAPLASASPSALVLSDGAISISELRSALLDPMPIGVTLFAVFDSGFRGLGLRYRFEDASSGPKASVAAAGRRLASAPQLWTAGATATELTQEAETSASVVLLCDGPNPSRGLLTFSFLQALERVYAYSLTLAALLASVRATFAANGCASAPVLESGQLLELGVPLGRLLAAPL